MNLRVLASRQAHFLSQGDAMHAFSAPDNRAQNARPSRLLRLPEVLSRIPYKKSQFYKLVKDGVLPAPVRLPGGRAVCWPENVIDELVERISRGEGVAQ